jgi:hypothetical protein
MKTKAKKNSRAWTPERRKRQAATIAARKAGKATDAIFQHNEKTGWAKANTPTNTEHTNQPDPYQMARVFVLRAAVRLDGIIDEIGKSNVVMELALKHVRHELTEDSTRLDKLSQMQEPKE